MYRLLVFIFSLILLGGCKQNSTQTTKQSVQNVGSKEEAQAFYEEMKNIYNTYPHRATLYRQQCENAQDILSHYHENGDVFDLPIVDFDYLNMFVSKTKPQNSYEMQLWRGLRSPVFNRLYPLFKFTQDDKWGETTALWDEIKKQKYILVTSTIKKNVPEVYDNGTYKRASLKGFVVVYNLIDKKPECYVEFSVLNKYNTPAEFRALDPDLNKALWKNLTGMHEMKIKEAINKGIGIPIQNIKLDLTGY